MKIQSLIQEVELVYKRTVKSSYDAEKIYLALMKKGWKETIGCPGCFKIVMIKEKLVVKFPRESYDSDFREIYKEKEQWENAPKEFRKHLAKIYPSKIGTLLFQEKVVNSKVSSGHTEECYELSKKYDLNDWEHNHYHTRKGIKFFDWVYNRPNYFSYW